MNIQEYNRCVDDCADGLFRFLLKNTKDEELSRDIVQDSFMRIWEKRDVIAFDKSKTYLFTTGYHLMIDHFRKNKKNVDFELVEYSEQGVERQYSDLKEILNEAVEKLPADQRSVLLLRDYEGYSYKEIADITGLSESQVKVYIYRARVFLKKYLVSIDTVV
jgi:RNA polymerase sigma-70 factor (ECF subfamily)